MFILSEPRQPRLHTVKDLTFGQPFPLLTSPRLLGNELGRAFSYFVGRKQFTTREQFDAVNVISGALIGKRELAQTIDFIAPVSGVVIYVRAVPSLKKGDSVIDIGEIAADPAK